MSTFSATLTSRSSASTTEGYGGDVTSLVSIGDTYADDANKVHIDCKGVILSGATLTIGARSADVFGATLATLRAYAVYLECDISSVGRLDVAPHGTNGWTSLIASGSAPLEAGATMIRRRVAGIDVGATDKDLLLSATGGDVTYRLIIIGSIA